MNGHQLWGWDKCKKEWVERRKERRKYKKGESGNTRRMWMGGDRGIWTVTEWKEERGGRWGWTDSEMESSRGGEVAVKWELLSAAWFLSPRQSSGHFFLGYLGSWQVEPALNQEHLESLGGVDGGAKSTLHRDWPFIKKIALASVLLLSSLTWWMWHSVIDDIFAAQLTWLVVWDKPCYTTFTV